MDNGHMIILERIAEIIHNPTILVNSKIYLLMELGIKRAIARKLVGI